MAKEAAISLAQPAQAVLEHCCCYVLVSTDVCALATSTMLTIKIFLWLTSESKRVSLGKW